MMKADIPPAPRRGHGSSRQTLKQKLDRTPGMRLFREEEKRGGAETVVHRTSSLTRNFFGSLPGLRQLAMKSSGSWLIRDMSVSADLNGLDTESNASSLGSVNRFGSALDLTGLIGLEEQVVGSQSSNSIFFRSQLDSGSRLNSLGGDLTPLHSRRNSLEGFFPCECDHGDDAVQIALEGMVASEERNRADNKRLVLVQACARRMLARKHYQAMMKGASTIQHVWRARQKHQQELRIVATVRILSCYRRWKCRKLFMAMVGRAVYIQACARRMLGRKHLQLQAKAALIIQSAWRAFSAQQKQQELRIVAAVRIQSQYRRWKCEELFKGMVGRAVYIQACARRVLVRKHLQLQVRAASIIQNAWRAFSARQKQQQELRVVAAVRIQSYFRGWIFRKSFKAMVGRVVFFQACARRMFARTHLQLQVNAASTIQQAWRTFRACQKHQQELELVAAVRVQSYYRGLQRRKLFKLGRVVYIQSCARRMLARRHYQAMVKAASTLQQAWRTFNAEQKHQQKLELIAVIMIQSYYRGWRSRNLFKTIMGRVVYFQSCARRMLARKHYREHLQSLVSGASVIQQAWRAFSRQMHRQDLEMVAVVKIQSFYRGWRCRKLFTVMVNRVIHLQSFARRMLARKQYQAMVKGASTIQHAWRARQKHLQVLQNLRLEKERAVILIQAHFRGRRVRIWLKRTHSAVTCIESAYWSYAQRRPKNERQYLGCERSSENYSPMIFGKESTLCGSNDNLDSFSLKSPLSDANSLMLANEMHNSDLGYTSSQCSVSLMEDWNNIPIDELEQCLDTWLAGLPLSVASSRQYSLEPSRQCLSTSDVVSLSIRQFDASSIPATPIERTPAPASFRSSEVEQDWVGVREVYGSAASETIESGSEISSPLHGFYPSPSQKLLVDEGEKPVTRSTSKDEERLQHFAEIFLTMRQISRQQERAQCAPPFPPSSVVPPQSPPILDSGAEVFSRTSRYVSPMALGPTPALNTGRSDVVLNMEELLKTLEQYCEESGGSRDMVTEGDIESGQNWRVRKTTSTPTLGMKHLKLLDVNAVLIVLVAMVVYTRTVCREVFFGTRQSPRKQ